MDPSVLFQKKNPVFRNREEHIQHLNKGIPASTHTYLPDKSWPKNLKYGNGIGYAGPSVKMNTASFSYHFYCVSLSKENMFEISVVN